VAVHPSRRVMVGEGVRYDPAAPRKAEDRARLMGELWRRITEMYAALEPR